VVAEDPEQVVQAHVDGGWLDHRLVERFDDDAAGREGLPQAAVGQNHDPHRSGFGTPANR